MKEKQGYPGKNIESLIVSGFNGEYRLNQKIKDETLQMLLQKVEQRKKVNQPETKLIVALSANCLVISLLLFFSELRISIYLSDLIKSVLGLSLVLIPFSSLVLIILNRRIYAKKMD
jgi:hypothetical protein